MFLILWVSLFFLVICFILTVILKAFLHKVDIEDVTNRSVFITGCDTGFGNLLARTLDGKGVRVFAGCLTEKGASELRKETSSRLKTVLIDVTDKASVRRAFEFVRDNLGNGGLWGLVNNAGVMPTFCPSEWAGVEAFESTCKVNLFGTIDVTLTFMPLLRRSCGRLVTVCSVTSNCAYPGISNYVVSKAAVKMFTACIRRELLNTGVTAHTIEPGGFKTNITDQDRIINVFKSAYKQATPELQCVYGGNVAAYVLGGLKYANKYVSHKPQMVADAMTHALLAKYPKRQYLVGTDAKLFFRAIRYLPEWMVDHILGWPRPFGKKAKQLET